MTIDPASGGGRASWASRMRTTTNWRVAWVLGLSTVAGLGCAGAGHGSPQSASPVAQGTPTTTATSDTDVAAPVAATPEAGTPKAMLPIRVGILHSLSGVLADNETSLRDIALMTIDEINAKGGVLGRQLEPVVVDPASNWPLFAERARELVQIDKVAVTFGCWPSISRKSVPPVFEELNGLLFCPVQSEGQESSNNVFYTGAVPNQQALPAAAYLMGHAGGDVKSWVLLGTDYVYPRTTNKILRYFLGSKGVPSSDIRETYTPVGHTDYTTIVNDIKKFAAGRRAGVVSSLWGDSNLAFFKELAAQGLKATDIPVLALSVTEEDLRGETIEPFVGRLAASSYFMSIDSPENKTFVEHWKAYVRENKLRGGDSRVTDDPMEATYLGIRLWAQAVEQAGTTDVDAVRQAMAGQHLHSPSGFEVQMDEKDHHLRKPVFIGAIQADGQFKVVWKSERPIPAQPWNPYLPGAPK
jgi:urea transport system substrate-binding protein